MAAKIQKFIEYFITYRGYVRVLTGLKNTAVIAVIGLLIGIVINFLRGWITDFTTAMVQKQQGVQLSKKVVAVKA